MWSAMLPDPAMLAWVGRFHHGSHMGLLQSISAKAVRATTVDAVIVPSARPTSSLREAMVLAREVGCVLVTLCSRAAQAAEAILIATDVGVRALAVDMRTTRSGLPQLATTGLLEGTTFESQSDLSTKRNLGLVIARTAGWERVLFLDDDIVGCRRSDVSAAAGLLDRYQAVGLHNAGYPDHSVVCRAFREIGPRRAQRQFIGAGAMAVAPVRSRSFFPKVYNEDWFFFLGEANRPSLARTGRVFQKKFDPFANPDRARREELGDVLAEGLFWLLDEHAEPEEADTAYWRDFLHRRRRFIEYVIGRVQHKVKNRKERERRLTALRAALGRNSLIRPSLCVDYLERWRQDLQTWRDFVAEIDESVDSLDEALHRLGLSGVTYRNFNDSQRSSS